MASQLKSMDELFRLAQSSQAFPVVSSMDQLYERPGSGFAELKYSRPAGYCAQTRVHIGGLAVPMLLDYGATVSAIPEEVACVILQNAVDKMKDKSLVAD